MLDEVFAQEIERYGITLIEGRRIAHETFLYRAPFGYRLSVRHDLVGQEKLEAVAVQVARIVLGHEFQRSGWRDERAERREWREALRWAAKRLIPDRLMSRASRLGWEAHQLAEEAGVTERLAWIRWGDWTENRGELLALFPPAHGRAGAPPL